jgi:RNA polymerase sigma factor (sigma-70 family)
MEQNTTSRAVRQASPVAQALVEHERLVHWVVRQQWLGALSYAGAVQAGRLALWRAAQGYDRQRGVAFSTYAVSAIRHAVWRAVQETQRRPWEQLCAEPPCSPSMYRRDGDVEGVIVQQELVDALQQLVAHLPPRLGYVIVAHYGLAEAAPQTFAAIGSALGITRQRAQQLHREALLWLAHPAHSLALRQLLDRNRVADYQAFLAQQRSWLRRRRGRR